jgi:hypothetical protein
MVRLRVGVPSRDAESRYLVPPSVECDLRSRETERGGPFGPPQEVRSYITGRLKASGYLTGYQLPANSWP